MLPYHLCRRGMLAQLVYEAGPVHAKAREALNWGAILCPQQPWQSSQPLCARLHLMQWQRHLLQCDLSL